MDGLEWTTLGLAAMNAYAKHMLRAVGGLEVSLDSCQRSRVRV